MCSSSIVYYSICLVPNCSHSTNFRHFYRISVSPMRKKRESKRFNIICVSVCVFLFEWISTNVLCLNRHRTFILLFFALCLSKKFHCIKQFKEIILSCVVLYLWPYCHTLYYTIISLVDKHVS